MKKYLLYIFLIIGINGIAQQQSAFKDGEWFRFRVSYSGWLKAGEATMSIKEKKLDGKMVYHVVGKGATTGAIKWFFKVKDRYESYFDVNSGLPYKFVRKINEGGHTKDIEIDFDHDLNKATVKNKKRKYVKDFDINKGVQDMVSTFYYLRNN